MNSDKLNLGLFKSFYHFLHTSIIFWSNRTSQTIRRARTSAHQCHEHCHSVQFGQTSTVIGFGNRLIGIRCAVLDHVEPKDILAELNGLLSYCKEKEVEEETITDINIKTLAYIKKCQKQKSPRNITMTKRYLKDNELLAIPFDKGIGICVMDKKAYHNKLDQIISLPQFEKVLPKRKNEMHPVLKEEQTIIETLKTLKSIGDISKELYYKIKPRGSQPAYLYDLAKVYKRDTCVRSY